MVVMAVLVILGGVVAENVMGKTRSGVTIHFKQSSGLYGFVFSTRPKRCSDRAVSVYRQEGDKQRRRDSDLVGRVFTFKSSNGKYKWKVRHPYDALKTGKYFAYIGDPYHCGSDYSQTIHISVPRPNTKITETTVKHAIQRVTFHYEAAGGTKPYTFRCHLDEGRFHACPHHEKTYDFVTPGQHAFRVRAIGANGRGDMSPAKTKFRM
jgi:hypothetical protein